MSQMPTIHLRQPITAVSVIEAEQLRIADCGLRIEPTAANPKSDNASLPGAAAVIRTPPSEDPESQAQRAELARLLEIVKGLAGGLHKLHEETLTGNRAEIARLAVEIARRILMYKVGKGDYEIQAIVEEALKRAPTRQSVVVRLNPEDAPRCQQLQQENPPSPLAELEFTADWNVGRGECLVETPKGIVRSFIEEHLEHISEALQKVE
jgi:flagellar biosynthesis/type III secretory pathway protein FliH